MEQNKEEYTLQELMQILEDKIEQLEAEDISLEDSFRVYEQGMQLIKECSEKIDRVEKRVLELNSEGILQEME